MVGFLGPSTLVINSFACASPRQFEVGHVTIMWTRREAMRLGNNGLKACGGVLLSLERAVSHICTVAYFSINLQPRD